MSACVAVGVVVLHLVDEAQGVEEIGDDYRGVHIIVHGLVTLAADVAHVDCGLCRGCQLLKAAIAFKHTAESLLGSLQSLVREVDRAAVVGL